jgi:hypothetical protein
MMSIMICSSLRHVRLIDAVQSSTPEQGTWVLDPGYDMTKSRSVFGRRRSQNVLVDSVALQRRRLRRRRTRLL